MKATSILKQWLIVAGCLFAGTLMAQNTETLYLSGTGLGDTKTWDFFCSGGMNSGKWRKIEVPSQWELQGFGEYTFGRFYLNKEAKPSTETGLYRHTFKIPADWQGKRICIVFEGVMTDTEVKINDQLAGEMHQGGFYTFSYDITDKVKVGKRNKLEVKVWKESANASVNNAERRADWWLFGGIYRPVYLKALPATHIERVGIDAKADGTLTTHLYTQGLTENCFVKQTLTTLDSKQFAGTQTTRLQAADEQTITTQWKEIRPWDNEHPNLYTLTLELLDGQGNLLHRHQERIGFRTLEFRERDGFYVNGTKVVMKGVNRHVFHPDGGRTTNKEISIQDALLIKGMNMNAVRTHYPPDRHFLDACDSLGLFFLEEFTGWHGKYDAEVGAKLVRETITADANHPCIFVWSNGNEGGWNTQLDPLFGELDPQKRHVIHAWADFNGVDTHHYPTYQTGPGRLANGYKVFMPTEFLHSQYDRGAGAGLQDFWANYSANPLFAGGFIWAFVDEAVKRTDKGGILCSDGPNGPDGIVGPYRQKEGSYYTIREVWAPIQFKPLRITKSFQGEFMLSNDYLFTNLRECTMTYRLHSTPSPLQQGESTLLAEGSVELPALAPGETGKARMKLPKNFFQGDVLELEAFDRTGKSICNWTWTLKYADEYFAAQTEAAKSASGISATASSSAATIDQTDERTTLSASGISATFSNKDGNLLEVKSGDKVIPLNNGPLPVGIKADFVEASSRMEGSDALFTAKFRGGVNAITWRMTPDGLLNMDALLLQSTNGNGYKGAFFEKNIKFLGLTFDFPEQEVSGMRWLGKGPYRVWKNRLPGANYGIWQKAYNNTITGESYDALTYPEFKGYHANLYWATLQSERTPFTVYSETDGVYLRLFTPEEPAMRRDGKNTMEPFPAGDLSFLLEIPGIQSFKSLSDQGPHSHPSQIRIKPGDDGLHIKLWFDFRQ